MEWNFESIFFYMLLIDALGANIFAFSGGQKWWQKTGSVVARHLPLSRGWTLIYLALTLFIGHILNSADLLTKFW